MEMRRGWFSSFFGKIWRGASNFLSLTISLFEQGRPIPGRFDTQKFVREAYEGNPLCYAATMEIATSMAEAPLCARIRSSQEEISDANPLAKILKRPNDFQSMPELIIETTVHMIVNGNCYWLLDNDIMPQYVQTLPSHCDQVQPMYKDGNLVYRFTPTGGKYEDFPASRILHFKEAPDLNDPLLRGMSPIVPIRRFIDIHNVLARYVDDFFHNNAVPPAMLIFKNKLTPQDVKRVEQEMRERHSTPGKYHSLGISFGDAHLERLGITVKDLDIKPVLDYVETTILQAFNIPPILVGAQAALGVSGWGNNFQEARLSFQSENLAPRQRLMEQVLNRGLAAKFGSRYEIYFDQSNVLALQGDRVKRREQANEAWNAGAMTLNEWRKEWGMKLLTGPEGDIRKQLNTGGAGTVDPMKKPMASGNGKAADVPANESEYAVAS